MQAAATHIEALAPIRTDLGAIFVSSELSRSKWLVTSVSPGAGEKMSKFTIRAGDIPALLARFGDLQRKGRGSHLPAIGTRETRDAPGSRAHRRRTCGAYYRWPRRRG
jgi:hypothetical protein